MKTVFSQVVTLERNWNLSTLPQLDGSGEGWYQWWRPFGSLRGTNDDICGFAPCSDSITMARRLLAPTTIGTTKVSMRVEDVDLEMTIYT
jgi:hypothetical protein